MVNHVSSDAAASLRGAFRDRTPLLGDYLGLYKYPARLSPPFVRRAIETFSSPNDWILDPFVGGGTTAIEALSLGRRVIAIDVNPIACRLTAARTTPLDDADRMQLRRWASSLSADRRRRAPNDDRTSGMSPHLSAFVVPAKESIETIRSARGRRAATAVLMRLGQRAVEAPALFEDMTVYSWRRRAEDCSESLLRSLEALAVSSENHGVPRSQMADRIEIYGGPAESVLAQRHYWRSSLVVTSPPYPGVHVLYHRWQLGGRRELALPFWIADERDGSGPSYYTMGGRHAKGLERYFETLLTVMRAIRPRLHPNAVLVQVVSFSDPGAQQQRFGDVLVEAGFRRHPEFPRVSSRRIPGRRWYATDRSNPASREFLLVHRA
jgi:DNA methylase